MLANFYDNVFGLPLSVWISDETVLVFDIQCITSWCLDTSETLLLVFDLLLLSVWIPV